MNKDYLVKKWLADELTDAEREAFEQLSDFQLHKDILDNAAYFKSSGFSKMDDFETFSKQLITGENPVRKINWVRPLLRIASVFVVGFTLYYFFLFNNVVEVQTLASQKTTIELPDASTVIVNAMSDVRYSKNKWKQKREVELQGEAFFDVAKGSKFDVITSEGVVSVLGTQFNVKQRGNYFEVECFEGIVMVTSHNTSEQLKEGDRYRFSNGNASLGNTIYQLPQWTKNISSFERIPIFEVIAELERQYNIEVISEKIQSERLFTGGFVHDNLEHALKSVTEPLDLDYTMENLNRVRIYRNEK
jgi:ferric-dicitrate binding protein FerR (iron transport regulator)